MLLSLVRTLLIRTYDVTEAERDDELGNLGDLHAHLTHDKLTVPYH